MTECTEGSGAACGSIYLTSTFEQLLKTRLGAASDILNDPNIAANARRMFENGIKCSFDPLDEEDNDSDDSETEDEYRIPVYGAPDNPHINLQRGYLALSRFSC